MTKTPETPTIAEGDDGNRDIEASIAVLGLYAVDSKFAEIVHKNFSTDEILALGYEATQGEISLNL